MKEPFADLRRELAVSAHLLRGAFTPFLRPFWENEEFEVAAASVAGAQFPNAIEDLEKAIADYLGGSDWTFRFTNLGRSAVVVALEAMRLPPSSEVALPSYSCRSLVEAVVRSGARPVFLDVDDDFNVSGESVIAAYRPEMRAVIVPHLAGRWARDLDQIVSWADKAGVWVIEDVAPALGLVRNGRAAGTVGHVSVFSAGLGKPLFGPGGGWVCTQDERLAGALRQSALPAPDKDEATVRLRQFASSYAAEASTRGRRIFVRALLKRFANSNSSTVDRSEQFVIEGMADVEAQLALLQMRKLGVIVERRTGFSNMWRSLLNRVPFRSLRVPSANDSMHSKMLLSFAGDHAEAESRFLTRELFRRGIETEGSYLPLHHRHPYDTARRADLSQTERQWKGAFSVPVRPNLDQEDQARIQEALGELASGEQLEVSR